MENATLELVITDFQSEAKDTIVLELQHPQQQKLPAFSAGAHLEVYLANGLIRHYSLLNASAETQRYVIAVGLSAESKGGSRYIHQQLRVGDRLKVSLPRNHFALVDVDAYCFVAGGIGITPILSMIHWCITHQKKWRLIYSARHKQRAAFYEYLNELTAGHIQFHFNDEQNQQHLNVEQMISSLSEHEHLYCCGPNAMMQSVSNAAQSIESSRVHFEWFSAPSVNTTANVEVQREDGFTLKLRKSGQEIQVMPEQSILEALEQVGFELPFSCRAGICRTCEVEVCAGIPEHHDMILSDEERAANKSMLICVSRAKSQILELDL